MATYADIALDTTFKNNALDELKPSGVDFLLSKEDLNTGWIQLSRNSSVNITHDFGTIPRLTQITANKISSDNTSAVADGADATLSYSITNMTTTTVTVKNVCSNTTNKYFKLLLWR